MREFYEHIAIELIDEDVSNHRLVIDSAADAELEQSIRTNGIQQPVKLNTKADGRYTLVWGFRRKAAAQRAGLTEIPAIIVEGLTNAEIRALQAIENLERKELHPLEEAQFCADLAETLTGDHATPGAQLSEAIAQRIGRSTKWVESRLAMARLSERVKQTFLDGDIHLQHANLIARLASHDAQEEVLGAVKAQVPPYHSYNKTADADEHKQPPATIAETRRQVEQRLRDLSTVPWKLEAEFEGKHACSGCPHNSANRLELFSDDAPQKPQCLLATCYAEKTKLASRAIQRATNTAMKISEKPTKAEVAEAIAEREVEFVQTAAVVQATKKRQDPTKPTDSERKGQQNGINQAEINRVLWAKQNEWEETAISALNKKLPLKDAASMAILLLIYNSELLEHLDEHDDEKAKIAAQTKLTTAVKQLKSIADKTAPTPEHALYKSAQALKGYMHTGEQKNFLDHLRRYSHDAADEELQVMLSVFGIDLDMERPTRESVEAELMAAKQAEEQEAA